MTRFSFHDDYSEGCHPDILDALRETNLEQHTAYGQDPFSVDARRLIASACGRTELAVHFVTGGTLANLIIASAVLRSHEAIIAAASGHIVVRGTGAIEATGHKIITMPSEDGRLRPADIEVAVENHSRYPHVAKPRLVYVSNATELGTVYSLEELAALRATCDANGLVLLVDGARLGVALASAHAGGMTLADLADMADIFWIGGTKAGTLFGEAIVIPNPDLAVDFDFHVKQRGALLSKGRSLGLQFRALFADGLFERVSRHANATAADLADRIRGAGYGLAAEQQSNQVFALLPSPVVAALRQDFDFYLWEERDDGCSVVRLVTSWATDPIQIERFADALARGA